MEKGKGHLCLSSVFSFLAFVFQITHGPSFKKGKKDNPGNYRPVSLTSIPSMIMELEDGMSKLWWGRGGKESWHQAKKRLARGTGANLWRNGPADELGGLDRYEVYQELGRVETN